MIIASWLKGMFVHRGGRVLGAICGVAVAVALLASIGMFTAYSGASMTKRAISDIPVDWQVQLVPGADIQAVQAAIGKTTHYTGLEKVGYADTAGFEASTGGTVQTTGPGKVLGISDAYNNKFPGEIRLLTGSVQGVLVAQQTAANLHIRPGDMVTVQRVGLSPIQVNVDGIVDLPNADSLFQAVGLPSGTAPQAPPDNVLLLPMEQWHQIFDSQANMHPDSVRMQLHVKINRSLPADPDAAYQFIQHSANNLEARIAGSGVIGDNLTARLAGVKEDALYAKVLFLFLGLPGTVLAVLLTLFIAASGEKHRRREQAVLRILGASNGQILKLAALEGLAVGVGGALLGMLLTLAITGLVVQGISMNNLMLPWMAGSAVTGLFIALVGVLYPAWKKTRSSPSVSVKTIVIVTKPMWQRFYIDIAILLVSAAEFWRSASTGYQVILAPEGVTAVSVNYEAFIGPFCLWIGNVLLALRFCETGLAGSGGILERTVGPIAKKLSELVAASLSRERIFIKRGIILVALAVSFAVSTSIFNTTYNAQARADAELTNGSDVTVTGLVPFEPGDKRLSGLKALPGISGLQLMQHKFAYVGNDLQDIYGIDAAHITDATNISDAYFGSGSAKKTLSALSQQRDALLVSEETVRDFQLQTGDQLNLRMQDAHDHQYHVIPFHFAGVVREFPTAPTDSFLVANADYISQMTGNTAAEIVLMRAAGSPEGLAEQVRKALGLMGIKVSDIGTVQRTINSSLTAVDLHGLTKIELVFAVLFVAGSIGLVLALGLAERRRKFAVLLALGAKEKQLGAFIWSEVWIMLLGGGVTGILLGLGVAQMLVKVLTGVFDPPPRFITIPWNYLAVLAACAGLSTVIAVSAVKRMCMRPAVEELRKL